MRVWKVQIDDSPTFHIAAENSTDAAAAGKILYAAIADSPEDARSKFYSDGHTVEVVEVCKLDSISMPPAFGQVQTMDINIEDVLNRAGVMLETLKAAIKKNVAENG